MEHIEDRNRGAVVGPQLRKEYAEIKHSEKKLLKAADELKKAMARSGSNQEISEVDNDVVSIQTRLGLFKQGVKFRWMWIGKTVTDLLKIPAPPSRGVKNCILKTDTQKETRTSAINGCQGRTSEPHTRGEVAPLNSIPA